MIVKAVALAIVSATEVIGELALTWFFGGVVIVIVRESANHPIRPWERAPLRNCSAS